MEQVLEYKAHPECKVKLQEMSRPTQLSVTIPVSVGLTHYKGGNEGIYASLGISLGIPLNRLREWQLLMGIHGKALGSISNSSQNAFLLGARYGLERRWTPSTGGLRLGGFAEVGGGLVGGMAGKSYGELGGSLGYSSPPERGGKVFSIELEAAAGSGLNFNDPETKKWFRWGFSASISF